MAEPFNTYLSRQVSAARAALSEAWQLLRSTGPGHVQFWFIALLIGIAAGFAALGFRLGI